MSEIALLRDEAPGLPPGGRLLGDERLAKLAGNGNERAFAALYERHHQAIYRYCRSILRNDQDAQDAMQSAMMRAYAALRSRERELAVKPWLFRIAHNESISMLRKRRPEDELSDMHEQPGDGVEGTLETRERLATLLADLQALPERQRGALLMRELSGLSIEQIGGALGVSPGAAKQALFEARSSLHELSEGRAMPCESVREAISQHDGRVLRSRRIRSHLRACEDCREFRAAIGVRSTDLAALAPPLPASMASVVLGRLLAHGGGHSSGGAAAAGTGSGSGALGSGTLAQSGTGASLTGHAAGVSLFGKGVAAVATLAVAAAGTAHFAASSHHHRASTRARMDAGVPGASAGASGASGSHAASGTKQGPGAREPKKAVEIARGSTSNPAHRSTSKAAGGAASHATAQHGNGASQPSIGNSGRSHEHGMGSERVKAVGPTASTHGRAGSRPAASRSTQGVHREGAKSGSHSRPPHSTPHTSRRKSTPTKRKPSPKSPANPPPGSGRSSITRENAAPAPDRAETRREVLSR